MASLDVHPHNLFEYFYYIVIGWNGLPLLHLKDLGQAGQEPRTCIARRRLTGRLEVYIMMA